MTLTAKQAREIIRLTREADARAPARLERLRVSFEALLREERAAKARAEARYDPAFGKIQSTAALEAEKKAKKDQEDEAAFWENFIPGEFEDGAGDDPTKKRKG